MKKIILLLFVISFVGCSTTNEEIGRNLGGVIGGAIGSNVGHGHGRTAAIVAGTLIGSTVGSSIGKHMDENDRRNAALVLERNKTYQPSRWRNPDSGNVYEVTPTRTYSDSNRYCREYQTKVIIDGRSESAYGTACRVGDSWKIVN